MFVWYVDENENDQGIWQTTDGGNTWTQLDDSGITNCGDFSGGCGTVQGTYNLELAAGSQGAPLRKLFTRGNQSLKDTTKRFFPRGTGGGQGPRTDPRS